MVADALYDIRKRGLHCVLRLGCQLVLEVEIGANERNGDKGNRVSVLDAVPVRHPEEIAEGLGVRFEILALEHAVDDAIGLTGVICAICPVVR